MESAAELNLAYLQAALTWLDIRLEYAIRAWQLAGQNPVDRFRGLYFSDPDILATAQRGIGTQWGSGVTLPADEEQLFENARKEAWQVLQDLEAQAEQNGVVLRLKNLQKIFELDDFEWWSLIICLAPACDLRYEHIYSYLQDDVTRVFAGVDLILHLLAPDGIERVVLIQHFDPTAPLRRFRLLQPVEESGKPANRLRQAFQVALSVVNWLLGISMFSVDGDDGLFPVPELSAEEQDNLSALQDVPSVKVMTEGRPFLCLHGEDAVKQFGVARQLAARSNCPLFVLYLSSVDSREATLEKLSEAVRDARMNRALLYVQKADVLVDGDGCLFADAFFILRLMQDSVLLGCLKPFKFHPDMPGNDYPLMFILSPRLNVTERIELWDSLVNSEQNNLSEKILSALGGQFNLTSGQIIASASTARTRAIQYEQALNPEDLFDAARFHSGHHLPELAHKIEPRYDWSDMVLPDMQVSMLQELVSMVQARPRVLETWGLGKKLASGNGVSALFSGPPGTGKTLAAQIIAHQLGIDLYQIDLSTLVSKYIGETEKNLEKIFSEASGSNAILFFDEADAIFGKRSEVKDAHDRYANIEVGYLLQRMETYSGITILATNMRGNLDDAFTRRLQFIVNFPFPDDEHRLRIWKVLMPPDLPCAPDLNLRIMAERFKLAGGNIRNIILSAAYFAASDGQVLTMSHLLHGARRELQKMERIVQESDFVLS